MWRLPNGQTILKPRPYTDENGVQHPSQIFSKWSRKNLREKLNIFPVQESKYNKRWRKSTGFTDELNPDGKVIIRTHTTEWKVAPSEVKRSLRERVRNTWADRREDADKRVKFWTVLNNGVRIQIWEGYITMLDAELSRLWNEIDTASTITDLRNIEPNWPNLPSSK